MPTVFTRNQRNIRLSSICSINRRSDRTENRICNRLARISRSGGIEGLLHEHILRHDAMPRGAFLLRAEVSERRLHSIATLSEVTGIARRHLTHLLQILGEVPDGISDCDASRLIFPADAMEQLCPDLSDAIPMEDVPDYIGA